MKEISAKSRDIYELMMPPVDVFEDGTDLVIVMDMPGFEKSKIKTRLQNNVLIVTAKREPLEKDGVTYWEQRPLTIRKRVPLPVKVKMDEDEEEDTAMIGQVKARYDNGVLTVRLPIKDTGTIPVE